MELLGLIVAIVGLIVALVIGLWHIRGIRHVELDVRQQYANLEVIRASVSTHFLKEFPHCLEDIVNLINKAQREVVILCDFPAYGSFSNPADFLKYRQAIERKIQDGISITITCFREARQKTVCAEQFAAVDENLESLKGNKAALDKLQRFLKFYAPSQTVDKLTKTEFLNLLTTQDDRMLRESFSGAIVHPVDAHLSLYFWVIDGAQAVFSIPVISDRASEYGFYTSDGRLIMAFEDMLSRLHRGSGA